VMALAIDVPAQPDTLETFAAPAAIVPHCA
jgi:hypothetical protein